MLSDNGSLRKRPNDLLLLLLTMLLLLHLPLQLLPSRRGRRSASERSERIRDGPGRRATRR
jgi:hypothetical protein